MPRNPKSLLNFVVIDDENKIVARSRNLENGSLQLRRAKDRAEKSRIHGRGRQRKNLLSLYRGSDFLNRCDSTELFLTSPIGQIQGKCGSFPKRFAKNHPCRDSWPNRKFKLITPMNLKSDFDNTTELKERLQAALDRAQNAEQRTADIAIELQIAKRELAAKEKESDKWMTSYADACDQIVTLKNKLTTLQSVARELAGEIAQHDGSNYCSLGIGKALTNWQNLTKEKK